VHGSSKNAQFLTKTVFRGNGHAHARMHSHIHTYTHSHSHTHTYNNTHTQTHTHTTTYTHAWSYMEAKASARLDLLFGSRGLGISKHAECIDAVMRANPPPPSKCFCVRFYRTGLICYPLLPGSRWPTSARQLMTNFFQIYIVCKPIYRVVFAFTAQASFVTHFCQIASRKLLFFHSHNSAVRVRDLLTSPLLQVRT